MKNRFKEYLNKLDLKFVGITVGIIIVISLLCLLNGEFRYSKKDLPEGYESNINKLIINEIVSSNKGVYASKNNEVCDYIEIYNGSDSDINLNGYGLSDNEGKIKWLFTNTVIKAKGYVVVNLVGKASDDPLDASFKLSSSKSERLIFTNPNSKIIDAVDTVSLQKNTCMARDKDGNWYIANFCTPGQDNSMEGLKKYHDSLIGNENSDVVINELLLRNKGNYIDGVYSDLGSIEIKNISDSAINLGDYYISDDIYLPFKKKLNNEVLLPGQIYVLHMGDGNYYDQDYLGFNFSSGNGSIVLGKAGKIVQELNYANLNNGDSLCYMNGEYYHTSTISIGYENDAEGIQSFQSKYLKNNNGLIINEVCNSNFEYLAQNGNEYYDYIELYNNSNDDIELSNYYLSDSDGDILKYNLPNLTLKAHEYYVIMCSGDTNLTNTSYYHANFKISDNDSIYLSDGSVIIDSMHIGNVPVGYSYGRNEIDGYYYMLPSPLEKNNEGYRAISPTPVIDLPAGTYDNVDTIKVSITCFNDVYYTLNGNEPTKNDNKYKGEIELNKTCVLKAKSFGENEIGSEVATATYVINGNHGIPVMCLSMNISDFDNINTHIRQHDYYFKGYTEYFDGEDGFSSNCGIGIYGDESRQFLKKNYVMQFSKEFGASDLAYQVFEDRDYSGIDTLCLRAGGQDWDDGIIRDAFMTSLIDDYTSVAAYTGKNVVLYINGNYWGIYSLKEKKSKSYFEENYNIDGDSINLIKGFLEVDYGSIDGYEEIRQYCIHNDVTTKAAYDYFDSKLDLTNWADFWIGHLYCANIDYNNLRFFQSDELNDGKWMCIFYDLDFGMNMDATHNTYERSLTRGDGFMCYWVDQYGLPHDRVDNTIIRSLLKNPYFCDLWLERLAYNLNTTWNLDRVMDRLNTYETELSGEINHDRSRWGKSLEVYNTEIAKLKEFVSKRQVYVLKYTKDFFKLSEQEMKDIFGELYE